MDNLSLAGCAIIQENKILLINRKKTGWYELPGGKIEQSETPEIAAKRELKEELLCEVQLIRKLGAKNFIENGFTMVYNWFLAEIKKGQIPQIGEPEKYDHLKFIPLDELSKYKVSPNMQNFMEELESKRITI